MLRSLSNRWWGLALRGILAIVFGGLALVWPDLTVIALVLLFGAFALLDGVLATVSVLARDEPLQTQWTLAFQGVLGMAVGITTFLWPNVTTLVLLYIIAFWLAFTGLAQLIAAIRLRDVIAREWLMILAGTLSVILAVMLVLFPVEAIATLGIIIGIYAIILGSLLIGEAFRARSASQATTATFTG